MSLDAKLLELLACPSCHAPIEVIDNEVCCTGCRLAYPIRDDIPVMLVDQARTRQG
jgi:uncharacterized protein YbaR (Trm112 family)